MRTLYNQKAEKEAVRKRIKMDTKERMTQLITDLRQVVSIYEFDNSIYEIEYNFLRAYIGIFIKQVGYKNMTD